MSRETTVLFRPVGPTELRLIAESGFRAFPPRLPEQPIFYPVLTEDYARQIARDWNVSASGAGYVTKFAVSWPGIPLRRLEARYIANCGYRLKNWANSTGTSLGKSK